MFRLFVVLFCFINFINAVDTLVIDNKESYEVLPYYEYLAVNDINETPLSLDNSSWHKDRESLNLKEKHSAYWIRVVIQNSTDRKRELSIVSDRRFIYSLEYYLVKKSKIVDFIVDGYYAEKNNLPIESTHRLIPFSIDKNEKLELYFKIQNLYNSSFVTKIESQDNLTKFLQNYNFWHGIFLGAILILILYNLTLYLMVHYKPYFYYITYLSFFNIYIMAYLGYFNLYTDMSNLDINMLLSIGIKGFLIYIAFFIGELFRVKEYLPKIYKVISFIQFYLFINLLLTIIALYLKNIFYLQLAIDMFPIFLPLYYIVMLYTLYYSAFKNLNRLAFLYVFTWSVIGLIGMLQLSIIYNLISNTIRFDYIFEFSMVIESILVSILLALRLIELEKEQIDKDKLIVRQNRLASMGEMISTIAHQWRQPLSKVNGHVLSIDMYSRKEELTPKRLEEHLDGIENLTAYMSETIDNFMNFFNTNKELEQFFLSEVIEQSIRIIDMRISSQSTDILVNDADDIELVGYKSELVQALLIVLNNSLDVCSSLKNPKISIVPIDKNKTVIIEVKDNGGGVPPKILSDIFNPYFTTKYKSKGTGLGLYILKMIIENSMGGEVNIKNNVDGAVCSMEIPKIIKRCNKS